MPLPPALLARLKARGIVPAEEKKQQVHEEVIAESYDDAPADDDGSESSQSDEQFDEELAQPLPDDEQVTGCPNKNNIYHQCTMYCREQWGVGKAHPSPRTERRYQKLIKRYPLPADWEDVWEPGLGCYYFWNTETDEVSWLPPDHPDAKPTVAAAKLRQLMRVEHDKQSDSNDSDDSDSGSESSESSDDEEEAAEQPMSKKQKVVDARPPAPPPSRFDRRFGRKQGAPAIDPMDPSSYSDAPRGKWGDGLGRGDD